MSKKDTKDGGSAPVTHVECGAKMEPLVVSVGRIEKALVGDDLQGGLVKKFEGLAGNLKDVLRVHEEEKKELKKRADYSRRMKIIIVTAFIGTIGSIICLVVDFALRHYILG